MGSKIQRQNKYMTKLSAKIRKFKKKEKCTKGLEKELSYLTGDAERPAIKTGSEADNRGRRNSSS